MQKGLICGLTNELASFEESCVDFNIDETVKDLPLEDSEALSPTEIKEKLSPEILDKIRQEQKYELGILGGVLAGFVGAILWGIVTVSTGFQIGFMAIGVAFLVGYVIRVVGKGVDKKFGYWGAGISVFSVLLGNFFSIIGLVAYAEGLSFLDTLLAVDYGYLPTLFLETFGFADLFFYGIAIAGGYRFSFKVITEKYVDRLHNIKISEQGR